MSVGSRVKDWMKKFHLCLKRKREGDVEIKVELKSEIGNGNHVLGKGEGGIDLGLVSDDGETMIEVVVGVTEGVGEGRLQSQNPQKVTPQSLLRRPQLRNCKKNRTLALPP
mmetsp:Transcript_13281/g.19864  ORF Transcript_13281/g.19864 Transcript_13281/m.19864 type:complete len:111 (-) Transcript_13281:1005-1337(-)